MPGNRISFWILILAFSAVVYVRFTNRQWERNESIAWDVFGYYLYLPANFIYDDPKLEKEWLQEIMKKYPSSPTLYQALPGLQGNKVILYTSGLAVLYSPFFFAGHAGAHLLDYPPDGYSYPYQLSLVMGMLLYTLVGLIFARKVLLRFFSDGITAILLLILAFGTNYFQLTSFDGTMPHNNVFMLYTIILWLTIRWHEEHKIKHAFLLGLVMGLTVIARGSEIVCLVIPFLWGVTGKASFRAKMQMLWEKKAHIMLLGLGMLIAVFPQLLYWKIAAGKWIYNSYGDAGFSFFKPYILEVLISYKKGWLVYTPVMIFAIIGLYFLYRYKREIFLAVLVYFIVNFYIVASWDVWWYAASYGQRALMQSYAVMLLPLGAFLLHLQKKGQLLRVGLSTVIGLLVLLNVFQTWQYFQGIIDPERMTGKYYWRAFLKTSVTAKDRKLLEVERSHTGRDMIVDEWQYDHSILKEFNFEEAAEDIPVERLDTLSHSGKYSFRLDNEVIFSPGLDINYKEITNKEYVWVRASAYIYSKTEPSQNPSSLVITLMRLDKNIKYAAANPDTLHLPANQWNEIKLEYITPYIISADDHLKVYIWHRGSQPVWVDDLKIEVFEPREDE